MDSEGMYKRERKSVLFFMAEMAAYCVCISDAALLTFSLLS